jgi:hypothetical protein
MSALSVAGINPCYRMSVTAWHQLCYRAFVIFCSWPHTTGFCVSAWYCATGRSSLSVPDHTLQGSTGPDTVLQGVRYCPWPHTTGFCFSAWYCATGRSSLLLTPHYRALFQCLMLCYRALVIVCSWPHTAGVLCQCLVLCYRAFVIVLDPTLQGSVSVPDTVLHGVCVWYQLSPVVNTCFYATGRLFCVTCLLSAASCLSLCHTNSFLQDIWYLSFTAVDCPVITCFLPT